MRTHVAFSYRAYLSLARSRHIRHCFIEDGSSTYLKVYNTLLTAVTLFIAYTSSASILRVCLRTNCMAIMTAPLLDAPALDIVY